MESSSCTHENAFAGARYCPECGAALGAVAPPREVQLQVSQSAETVGEGGMVGMQVGELNGSVTVVQGNVYRIDNPTPEVIATLSAVKQVKTEVQPAGAVREPGGQGRLDALETQMAEILRQVRSAERRGERVDEVRVGDVRLSRVELLLKEAVLLKAEADQRYFDQIERNKPAAGALAGGVGEYEQIDLSQLLQGFDEEAHAARLRQAFELLREAQALEPANAEVLLHLVQVMEQLDHDPRDVRRILYQIEQLLNPPRSDTERFHLAQATFLSATLGEFQHPGKLRNARDMFAALGRSDWVRHCEDLLGAARGMPATLPATTVGGVWPPPGVPLRADAGETHRPNVSPATLAPAARDDGNVGHLGFLFFFIPIVGAVMYFVWKDRHPLKAQRAAVLAGAGLVTWILLTYI